MSKNRFIHNIKSSSSSDTFIILGAGVGRRMRNYGCKSLLKYKEKKILDHQIDNIKSFSKNADIIFVGGFEIEKVIKGNHDCRIIENQLFESTNSVESLRLGINASKISNLFIIHGDIVFTPSALNIPNRNMAFLAKGCEESIDKDKVGISHQEDKVLHLSYGLEDKWSQIVYIPYNHFISVKHQANKTSKKLTTYEFINLLNEDIDFYIYENSKNTIFEIDTIKDIQ